MSELVQTTPGHETTRAPGDRRLWLAGGLVLALGGTAMIAAKDVFAGRIVAGLLPDPSQVGFARDLVHHLGVAALATGGLFLLSAYVLRRTAGLLDRWAAFFTVSIYTAASLAMWWYVNDDAGISFTYARNLVEGHGLVFNVGDAPLEGYSNPLWVLLLAGAHFCGFSIVTTAKVLGLLGGVGCIGIVWYLVRPHHPVVWLALPLVATNAAWVIWTSSGLENAAHALLLTALILVLARETATRGTYAWMAIVLALLVLSRPEGPVFGVAATVCLVLRFLARRIPLAAVVLVPGVAALGFAGLLAFRYLYFGDILPNTYYAKASASNPLRVLNPYSGGWLYVGCAWAGAGWTVLILPLFLLLRRRAWSPLATAAAAVVAAQLFFVITVGGDWMSEFRFISPIVPAVAVLAGLGLDELRRMLLAYGDRPRTVAALCVAPVLLIAASQLPRLVLFADRPTTPLEVVAKIGQYFVDLAERAGIENPTLLHHDAGGTSYVAGIRLIDLGGLCDRTIGKHWRDRERIRRYIFEERRPTFIYSARVFAEKVGLERFPEFERDYLPLPPPPSPDLDGYIRCVRADLYDRVVEALDVEGQ